MAPAESAKQMAEKFEGNYFGTLPEINESDLMNNKLLSLINEENSVKKIAYNPLNE
jgi:hypothetical protein